MTEEAIAQRRKPSSPAAPGLDLKGAVSEVAKVYSRYSHGSFTKGELASALGMSSTSGTFLGKAAALRDYGLIEDTSGGEHVSDIFKAIYQAPPGSAELKRAATAAITHSVVFGRLLQQFSSRVPDEIALALRLETQDRFNSARARVVAGAFRRSMADFGLIDAGGNVLPVRDDAPGELDKSAGLPDIDQETRAAVPESGMFRVEVPLGAGRRAVILLPEDFSSPDARRVVAVLRAYVDEAPV